MAKVVLTFEDDKESQMISFYSDRDIDLDGDLNSMTPAEQLASIAVSLLDEYVSKAGADVERTLPVGKHQKLN